MGSFVPTAGSVERQWHVIDAEGMVLGRMATDAARLLQGKHKPVYTPHIDTGDHVVIVNAAKVRLTGRKEEQKLYRYHSGYEGGLREERAKDVRQKNPVRMSKRPSAACSRRRRWAKRCGASSRCTRERSPARRAETAGASKQQQTEVA